MEAHDSGSGVRVTAEGPVLRVRLDRPSHGNALDRAMLHALAQAYGTLHEHSSVRVVELSALGPDFCVGADLAEMTELLAEDVEAARDTALLAHRVCAAIAQAPVVTVARLHGRVIGAGLALAIGCDLRICTDDSTFRLPELLLGVPPLWGGTGPRLIAEVGAVTVRRMLLLGERLDAAAAQRAGLVHHQAPAAEVGTVLRGWTARLGRNDPRATRLALTQLRALDLRHRLGDLTAADADLLTMALASRR